MNTLPVWLLFARSTAFDRLEDLLTRRFPAEAALATNGVTRRAIKVSPRISERILRKQERDDTIVSLKGFPLPLQARLSAKASYLSVQIFDKRRKSL